MEIERKRFKVREERIGATLFDLNTGIVSSIPEDIYQNIVTVISGNKKMSEDSRSYLEKNGFGFLIKEGHPDFRIYWQKTSRENLPKDCLSAPSKVYLELTRRCNLFCKNCYNSSSNKTKDELSTEEIFKIIDILSERGCFELRLTGGEPTLRDDFLDIVKYAKDKELFLSLGTNGVWKEGLAEKIISSGIRNVIISIDGPEDINDGIRGKGSFKKAIESINALNKTGNITIKINFTFGKDNLKYLEDVAEIAYKNKVSALNVSPIRLTGRASEKQERLATKEDMLDLVRRINILRKKYPFKIQTYFDILGKECGCEDSKFPSSLFNKESCAAGIEVMVINPTGDVYGCAVSPGANIISEITDKDKISLKQEFTAGNLRKENMMKIWLDSSRWEIYRNLDKNKSRKCKSCRHYIKNCFGNCVISSYIHNKKPDAADPYCFVDLIGDNNE